MAGGRGHQLPRNPDWLLEDRGRLIAARIHMGAEETMAKAHLRDS